MRSQKRPSFKKLQVCVDTLKKGSVYIKYKIQRLWRPSIKKLNLRKKPHTKWVLAETTDINNKNKQLVLVEVEQFGGDEHHGTTIKSFPYIPNYTIEGEDPNLRITHFPSNRLH